MRLTFDRQQKELAAEDGAALEALREALKAERLRVDELQVSLGEAESERDVMSAAVEQGQKVKAEKDRLETMVAALENDCQDLRSKLEFQQVIVAGTFFQILSFLVRASTFFLIYVFRISLPRNVPS